MRMHQSITAERVMDAVEREMTTLDNPGFCVACGAEATGCEPDARGYECESCGEAKVYGAAELLMEIESMGARGQAQAALLLLVRRGSASRKPRAFAAEHLPARSGD